MTPSGVKFRAPDSTIIFLPLAETAEPHFAEGPRQAVFTHALNPRTVLSLLFAVCLTAPGALRAQERSGPLLPPGLVRLEIPLLFEGWDERFGPEGNTVPLGSDFSSAQVDATVFPGIASLQDALGTADPDGDFPIDMGATDVHLYRERITVPLRLEIGLFDWLSIGGTLPLSKRRAESFVGVDGTGANAGVSPALTDPTAVSDFLGQFGAAEDALSFAATEICESSGAGSADCENARAVQNDVSGFRDALEAAYLNSAAFPLAETDAATALQNHLSELEQAAGTLGVSLVPTALPLSTETLDDETFGTIVSAEGGSIQGVPLGDWESTWEVGDAEVFAHARVLGSPLIRRPEDGPAVWTLGVGALVRLGTGTPDSPDNFVDLGAGDGTTDVEGRVFFNLRANERFGVWADALYGVQGSVELDRRITPSNRPLAPRASLQTVSWTPGTYLRASIVPRLHLTDEVALAVSVSHLDRNADEYEAVAGSGGFDVSVLEEATARRLTEVGVGAIFSTLLGDSGRLMEARFRFVWPVSASEGRFRKANRIEMGLRFFRRFWGEPVLRD